LGNVVVTGAFAQDLTVAAVNQFRAGAITGGSWHVSGNIGGVTSGSVSGWNATVGGSLAALKVLHDANMALTAGSAKTMSIGGNLSGSSLTFTQQAAAHAVGLGALAVRGAIVQSVLNAAANIGAVTATSMTGTHVYAGVATLPTGQTLPDRSTDFTGSVIGSVTLRNVHGAASYTDSSIAASRIGRLILGGVQPTNGGTPFGIAADQLSLLQATDAATGKQLKLNKLTAATPLATLLNAQGFNPQDLVIRLV
jgi:hypothetical protein